MNKKIIVDRDVCIGAGTCARLARATFALDDDDIAVVISEDRDDPATIDAAIKSCPSGAIIVIDADDSSA